MAQDRFLARIRLDDGGSYNRLCNENEIIRLQNESDFNGISGMDVWDLGETGIVKKLHYVGWQPGCHIQFVDEDRNVVIDGYGDDH